MGRRKDPMEPRRNRLMTQSDLELHFETLWLDLFPQLDLVREVLDQIGSSGDYGVAPSDLFAVP